MPNHTIANDTLVGAEFHDAGKRCIVRDADPWTVWYQPTNEPPTDVRERLTKINRDTAETAIRQWLAIRPEDRAAV